MAPIAPFITEQVWQDLVVAVEPEKPQSVHLAADGLLDPIGGELLDLHRADASASGRMTLTATNASTLAATATLSAG